MTIHPFSYFLFLVSISSWNSRGVIAADPSVSVSSSTTCATNPLDAPLGPTTASSSFLQPPPPATNAAYQLYLIPEGSLIERLSAITSALHLAHQHQHHEQDIFLNATLHIVWPPTATTKTTPTNKRIGYYDLYQSPLLPIGPFPSGSFSSRTPGCILHRVTSYEDFVQANTTWDRMYNYTTSTPYHALCIVASTNFLPVGRFSEVRKSFYTSLLPSQQIVQSYISPYMSKHQWRRWGQWIGLHACRSEDCVRAASTHALPLPHTGDYLVWVKELTTLPLDGESLPRFFIASEDRRQEVALQQEVWGMNLTGAKGAAVVLEGEGTDSTDSTDGMEREVVKLYLLSQTSLIVGTKYSEFSEAAVMGGGNIFSVYVVGSKGGGSGGEENTVRKALFDTTFYLP